MTVGRESPNGHSALQTLSRMSGLTTTHTSTVTEDQIDHLGHMNVRFYAVNARAGTDALLADLGLGRTPRRRRVRHVHPPPSRATARHRTRGPQRGARCGRRLDPDLPRARERIDRRARRDVRVSSPHDPRRADRPPRRRSTCRPTAPRAASISPRRSRRHHSPRCRTSSSQCACHARSSATTWAGPTPLLRTWSRC